MKKGQRGPEADYAGVFRSKHSRPAKSKKHLRTLWIKSMLLWQPPGMTADWWAWEAYRHGAVWQGSPLNWQILKFTLCCPTWQTYDSTQMCDNHGYLFLLLKVSWESVKCTLSKKAQHFHSSFNSRNKHTKRTTQDIIKLHNFVPDTHNNKIRDATLSG